MFYEIQLSRISFSRSRGFSSRLTSKVIIFFYLSIDDKILMFTSHRFFSFQINPIPSEEDGRLVLLIDQCQQNQGDLYPSSLTVTCWLCRQPRLCYFQLMPRKERRRICQKTKNGHSLMVKFFNKKRTSGLGSRANFR